MMMMMMMMMMQVSAIQKLVLYKHNMLTFFKVFIHFNQSTVVTIFVSCATLSRYMFKHMFTPSISIS